MKALMNLTFNCLLKNPKNFNLTVSAFKFKMSRFASSKPKTPEEIEKEEKTKDEDSILNLFPGNAILFPVKVRKSLFHKEGIFDMIKKRMLESEISQQILDPERHKLIGADLSAAHFVVSCGGGVKFSNKPEWIYLSKSEKSVDVLPDEYEADYILTGIDISNTRLRREALSNFQGLTKVTHLSISNCEHADDWWLDTISGQFNSLKHLDISECPKISYRGVSILYRVKELKTLIIGNVPYSPFLEMTLLQLEQLFPNLVVHGIDNWKIYINDETNNSTVQSEKVNQS